MRHDAEPAAVCEGLVRIYWSPSGEVHALKGVDAVVPAGRLTAITGPSGSGKSSLLRILAAQDRPTAGRAEVAGHRSPGCRRTSCGRCAAGTSATSSPGRRRTCCRTSPPASTWRWPRGCAGSPGPRRPRRARSCSTCWASPTAPSTCPGSSPAASSSGWRSRRPSSAGPALVVADEPTSELDSATTADLLGAVHELTRTGTTVVMATHDPLAAGAADQVIHLRSGTVAHEEVGGRRLAVIDGDGRVQLPEEALRRFAARRVLIDVTDDGVVLREPS